MLNPRDIRGAWRSEGYGQIWEFSGEGLVIYDTSPAGCIENKRETPDALEELLDRVELHGNDRLSLYQKGGITRYDFRRFADAASACRLVDAAKVKDPELNFEVLWHYFDENYAFFKLRGIDWRQVYSTFRPQVTPATSDDELIGVFREMIELLGDSHVGLKAGKLSIKSAKPDAMAAQWKSEFGLETGIPSLLAGLNKVRGVILEDALRGEGQTGAGGMIVWGKAAPRIGYLGVLMMYGYAGLDASLPEQMLALASTLDRVMGEFRDVDAAIVDVRFNHGGMDSLSQMIANRFADRKRLAFTKKAVLGNGSTEPQEIYVHPEGAYQFTGPTVLMTSEATLSAAEIFTMCMMGLPYVTRMGGATDGALSDVLTKKLPNGWSVGLSNEIYTAADGRVYEMTGIPVDVEVPVFVPGYFYGGLQLAVDKATALLQNRLVAAGKSRPLELDAFISDRMSRTHMAGVAACAVRGDKMIWSRGYGWADIERRIPMTPDTVINIASISKTITNAAVMQCWERGLVQLDDDVSRLIPIEVRNPAYPDTPITVLQLLTHTSSISDGPAYLASYACGDPAVSLADWIEGNLRPGGAYYDAQANFHPWKPGERFAYSNVGFGLLGYLVEQRTGQPFSDYCRRHIFEPLGMRSTAWFLRDLQGVVPAVPYTYAAWGEMRGPRLAASGAEEKYEGFVPNCLYGFPNYPDGLLHTSVRDLAAFLMAHMNGGTHAGQRLLKADTVKQITAYRVGPALPPLEGAMIGLTWYVQEPGDKDPLWGHGGGDPGVNTSMSFRPADGVGVIVFSNTSWAWGLAEIVARLYDEAHRL